MNVTRAVLPFMRKQRRGHIITISSLAGLVGQEFCVAYAAARFGVEGWMESLRFDLAPFGIDTTIVEPGFFRTELLVDASTTWAELSIADYAESTSATKTAWQAMNGQQAGDPAKLADAIITIAEQDNPPARFVAGADAIAAVEAKANELREQADASRELGMNLAVDDIVTGRPLPENHERPPGAASSTSLSTTRKKELDGTSLPPTRTKTPHSCSPATPGGTSSAPAKNPPVPASTMSGSLQAPAPTGTPTSSAKPSTSSPAKRSPLSKSARLCAPKTARRRKWRMPV